MIVTKILVEVLIALLSKVKYLNRWIAKAYVIEVLEWFKKNSWLQENNWNKFHIKSTKL
jgi:hypothetical protein